MGPGTPVTIEIGDDQVSESVGQSGIILKIIGCFAVVELTSGKIVGCTIDGVQAKWQPFDKP